MLLLPPTLLFLSFLPFTVLGDPTDTCDPTHNGLTDGTLEFKTDCNVTTWCDNGTCKPKGCRKDEFPLGWPSDIDPPNRCGQGTFCPDEESDCQSLLTVGSGCQLDRDDECEGPPNFADLRDDLGRGLNVNGSICLNFVCQWANVTVGQQCDIENTGYIAYGIDNKEFVDVVSRDNCKLGLYCDVTKKICIQQSDIGGSCSADKECLTLNCEADGVCGQSPAAARHLATWIYAVIGVGIFGGMFGTLVVLFCLHGRQRDTEREKRLQYWREQNAFRQNIMQMRETARASIFTSPNGGSRRSTLYSREGINTEDSQAPMLQHAAPKASGLRHYVSDDGSYEDDGLVMQPPYGQDRKAF